jgi:hypothetical protein
MKLAGFGERVERCTRTSRCRASCANLLSLGSLGAAPATRGVHRPDEFIGQCAAVRFTRFLRPLSVYDHHVNAYRVVLA